mmetsp:Transcript_37798/g.121554  ORF Transcript_37798/g.121554 Transcript_37798/m.121554 type:complete len:98 (-) Transcript_37798:60-353(-)
MATPGDVQGPSSRPRASSPPRVWRSSSRGVRALVGVMLPNDLANADLHTKTPRTREEDHEESIRSMQGSSVRVSRRREVRGLEGGALLPGAAETWAC